MIKTKKIKKLLPPPVSVDHSEYSMIFSSHDDHASASTSLIKQSIQAISHAMTIDLSSLSKRLSSPPYYPNIWPGEHYKLLAGFTQALNPKIIIEIGTATGLSSLSFKHALGKEGKIYSFDLFSWEDVPKTVLTQEDFVDERLVQYVDDLSQQHVFDLYKDLLVQADLIFIDAAHDGELEKQLLDLFCTLPFTHTPYFIFDDIRVFTMLKMWREVTLPKLDLTSFGHWSGTGIVEGINP